MSEYNLRILDFMHSRGLKNGSRPVGFRGKVYKVSQKLKPFSNAECIIGMFY